MKRALLTVIVIVLYVLHQDFWFWRDAHPLLLGFIPIGLSYHAVYTLVTALVMWLLVKYAWPSNLEGGLDFSLSVSETGADDSEKALQPESNKVLLGGQGKAQINQPEIQEPGLVNSQGSDAEPSLKLAAESSIETKPHSVLLPADKRVKASLHRLKSMLHRAEAR